MTLSQNWWKILLGFAMSLVILGAFLYSPRVEDLGETTRVLFFHVPCAWIGFIAFIVSMVYSVRYLRKEQMRDDIWANASSQIGMLFTLLATITGAIWAKATWQAYWNWDPRQISIFLILLIYAAYFTLRSAIEEENRRARMAAVYSIIAAFTLPFLMFLVPRMYESLHPEPVINARGKVEMDPRIQTVLYSSAICFAVLYYWMLRIKVQSLRLERTLEFAEE